MFVTATFFFCPEDPFAKLSPEKTPSQGMPGSGEDYLYARSLDHSITSYMSCPGAIVRGEEIDIEDWFAKGYYLTTDIYQNIVTFPRDWLYSPIVENGSWDQFTIIHRLHTVTVFAIDYTHFFREGFIELFYDGSVDVHTAKRPCHVWKQLEARYKPKEGGKQ